MKLNPGTVGFYRTKYPLELLKQLIPSVSDKTLPPLDRLGILDDLFALVSFPDRFTSTSINLLINCQPVRYYLAKQMQSVY